MTKPQQPPGFAPPPRGYSVAYECWSLLQQERFSRERADLVVDRWPKDAYVQHVLDAVNAKEGPTVTMPQLRSMVENFLTVRRPPGVHWKQRDKRAANAASVAPPAPLADRIVDGQRVRWGAWTEEEIRAWADLVEICEDDCQVVETTAAMRRTVVLAEQAILRLRALESAALPLTRMVRALRTTPIDSNAWAGLVRCLFGHGRGDDPVAVIAALYAPILGPEAAPQPTETKEAPTNE